MAQDSNNWQQQVWQQPDTSQSSSQPQQSDDVASSQQATSQPQPGASMNGVATPGAYAQPYVAAGAGGGGGGYGQPPTTPPPPQPRRSRAWIVVLVAIVLIFVLIVIGIASCTSAVTSFGSIGSSSTEFDIGMVSDDTIGIIELDGTIDYDGTVCSPEGFKEQLDNAANSDIKAVVLRVNSGGGGATAAEEMTTYLKDFREETGKPVVVSSASSNASGAYEISSQADYIFTPRSASIGAIGTAMQVTDLSGLYDMLGINIDNITSAGSKDSTYGTRPLTDEEREYYQAMVDQINDMFIESVAEGRDMSVEDVTKLATGLTFTGTDAVENGLADEIGTLEDALDKAAELAELDSYDTVTLEPDSNDLASLLDLLGESDISVDNLVDALEELQADGDAAK